MASRANDGNGHLDATTDREVVYCHACSHEWYRDNHGLECPECHSDITEVIEPDNDPRDLEQHRSSASTSPEPGPYRRRRREDEQESPEAPDSTEYLGPNGFAFQRSVQSGPDQRHHNPAVDPVLERFVSMLSDFRSPGIPGLIPRDPLNPPPFTQGRIQRTTFSTGPFGSGTTSVTIVSGPLSVGRSGANPGSLGSLVGPGTPPGLGGLGGFGTLARGSQADNVPPQDPFQSLFSNALRDNGPPDYGNNEGAEVAGRPPAGFARSLHDILALFNPENAMAGDAVYSQEALDRIITSLMEANPPSNAAPPATDAALENLTRKPVDKEMLGTEETTECTICIDEMKMGETVIYLPCKHWFHEDCVVLWLKEHNTCPICRTPIEKIDRNNRINGGSSSSDNSSRSGPGEGSSRGIYPNIFPPPSTRTVHTPPPWFTTPRPRPADEAEGFPHRRGPPVRGEPVSFGDALRQISRERERERREQILSRRNGRAFAATAARYESSRLQRRSSHSPTSPRMSGPEEHGSRMRERSPSQSRWSVANREQEQRRPSGHGGPLGWFRDRFGGGSSGNGNGNGTGNGSGNGNGNGASGAESSREEGRQ